MRIPKKKRAVKEIESDEGESRDSRGFGALEELTSSDVIAQVKLGMSVIADDDDEENPEAKVAEEPDEDPEAER
jgi:hypothetical protein